MEGCVLDLPRFGGASVSVEELRRDRSGGNDSLYGGIVCGYGRRSENNRACRSKAEVERLLSRHRLYEYMDFETDTIGLERMVLIFENDTLKAVAEYR